MTSQIASCGPVDGSPAKPSTMPVAAAAPRALWWRERELWLLLAVVGVIYFSRLTTQPICGEESRWANGAAEMIAGGDWIVPRQQGDVFPERPPLGSWAMAVVALIWGRMDAIAVRLPSALAMLITVTMIYGYGRTFLSRLGALGAAAAYASAGQVLVLGRLGESEAVFAGLLGSALLLWHWGYTARWNPTVTWMAAYFLAALAALDKGSQAPVYMATASVAFLAMWGDWRYLLSWAHLAGVAVFLSVVGAWQIPYYLATDWNAVADTWSGLAADRFSLDGLGHHMLTYPWETFGCLLPWSPMFVAYFFFRFRRTLANSKSQVTFLVSALAVTYPSVWLSAGARGRYFMPLYPCLALLIGFVVQNWAGSAPDGLERWAWRWYLRCVGLVAAAGSLVILAASVFPIPKLSDYRQPMWLAIAFWLLASANAWLLWSHGVSESRPYRWSWLQRASMPGRRLSPQAVLLLSVAFLGIAYTVPVMNLRLKHSNDLGPPLAQLRESLPPHEHLVSFGAVAHRFVYFYGEPIKELAWPVSEAEVPAGVTYFCYDLHRGDNAQRRLDGRGRKWTITPAALPFDWEPIGVFPAAPLRHNNPDTTVIVGRILRSDERLSSLDGPADDFHELARRASFTR